MRKTLEQAAIIAGAWTLVGLFLATQHHLILSAPALDLPQRLSDLVVAMLIWMALTPLVMKVADRLPLGPPHRFRNLALLSPIGLAVAFGRAAIDVSLPTLLRGELLTPAEMQHAIRAQLHPHLLFFAVIVGIANFLRLQRETAERERREAEFEAELANAQLRRLRADLQPHFLFNTLNAIAALVHTDVDAAERTLATLSDLLRRSLEAGERAEVTLAEDLDFIERYLDLQRTRFGNRLRARTVVSDSQVLHALIPPLLIQPLVENAIVHGVAKRSNGGTVTIRASRAGDRLLLQVRDDGPGSDEAALFRGGSIGVPNTKARLEYLYGAEQSLEFHRDGGEFVAAVSIPFHRDEAAMPEAS